MARKKFYKQSDTDTELSDSRWKVGLYVRLSREDGDKRESDSVVNQKNC